MPFPPVHRSTDTPPQLAGLALDHVAIAVPDLDGAAARYALLGFRGAGEDELVSQQGVRVRLIELDGLLLELLQPTADDTPIGRFLRRHGAGLHHLALSVSSLESEMTRLWESGARFTAEQPRSGRGGSKVAFLHPSWTGGVLVELVEHA